MADYDRISPGLALRLVDQAEAEARHRRALETRVIDAQIQDRKSAFLEARIGQICALFIAVTALVAGSYAAIQGKELAGAFLGIGGVGGIVATFVLGRARSNPPPEQRPALGR